ncbi:MAG: hypothetical protein IIB94_01220 [Candidatus Marinimicrobia bacterium]|nr:hypothetical protein [Candidatus Neomarinimicrobiota bacterium]
MYIVRDKKTKKVIHVNHAPLSQKLSEKEIYFKFDGKKMEIGKTDRSELSEQFHINKKGEIVEFTLQDKVEAGILTLDPAEKVEGDQVVQKTLREKAAEGIITLEPDRKIVGEGDDERIEQKTFIEKVAEGLVKLEPDQKLVGEEIVEKTSKEMLKEGIITLDEYKHDRIENYSRMAFEKRAAILPDYKMNNASLGIYDEKTSENYKLTVIKFRDEFHRIKNLIEKVKTVKKIDEVKERFPNKIVVAKKNRSGK